MSTSDPAGSEGSAAAPAAPRSASALTLLAVLLVRIDVPDVEDRLLRRVPDGEDGRHHRVVLIIAGVQAGTAGRVDVQEVGVQPVLDRLAVLTVIAIVNRVGIRDADDTTVDDIRARATPISPSSRAARRMSP